MHTRTQGKRSNLIGAWARPACWSWKVSWRGGRWLWLTLGTQTLVADLLGNIQPQEHSWWLTYWIISTKTWLHPTACRLQCCEASGHTTNWAGTQPHPSADRLPNDFLSPQSPLDSHQGRALPARGPRPSSTHQWVGLSPSLQEACTSLTISLTHQGTDTRSKKTTIPQCRLDPTPGPAEAWPSPLAGQCKLLDTTDPIPNCIRKPPPRTNDLKRVLGSLGHANRLQEPALPASSPALTPGSGFTCQWVGNSPRVFGTLAPPTSKPALPPEPS